MTNFSIRVGITSDWHCLSGIPESTALEKERRYNDDVQQLTVMLNELNCNEAQIQLVVRLGKPPNGSGTEIWSQSQTDKKPRPVKLVFTSEIDKQNVLKASKNLAVKEEGVWKRVFIHQDLTMKEREVRKRLVQELKSRQAAGETDLMILNGNIVKITWNRNSQLLEIEAQTNSQTDLGRKQHGTTSDTATAVSN